MDEIEFGPLNIEIRARETQLLDDHFYQQLVEAPDIAAALKHLQGTPYDFLVSDDPIEPQLMTYLQKIYQSTLALAPNKKVVEFAGLKYTYHNLKVLFKQRHAHKDLSHLLIPIGHFSPEVLREAVITGASATLPEAYLNRIVEVRNYLENYHNIHSIDVLLDYYYLEHMMELADALGDALVIDVTKEYIDLHAIIIAIRLLRLGKPVSNLAGMVPDEGFLSNQQIIDWAKDGEEGLTQAVMNSHYRNVISKHLDGHQQIDAVSLEKVLDNRRMELLQEAKFEAFGPRPLLAYLLAKETEIKNLRVILNGMANDLPAKLIRKNLRDNYR